MKKSFVKAFCLIFSFAIAAGAMATSTPAGFVDDMKVAVADATRGRKPIIAVFTGSDWCKYCMMLESNVLSKPEFARDASKEFALLFVDNPQDKNRLSSHAKAENAKLTQEFGVQGFPTVMLLDCFGQRVGRMGGGGSPAEFLEQARRACKQNESRLASALEIAALKKGSPQRLQRIADEIDKIDVARHGEYPSYCAELLAKGGKWKAHLPYQALVEPLEKQYYKIVMAMGLGKSGGDPATSIRKLKALEKKLGEAERKAPAGLKPRIDALRKNIEETVKGAKESRGHSRKG